MSGTCEKLTAPWNPQVIALARASRAKTTTRQIETARKAIRWERIRMVDNATADILGIGASRNVFAAGSIVRIVAGSFVRRPKNPNVCALSTALVGMRV